MAFDADMLVEGTMIFQAPIHLTCFKSSTRYQEGTFITAVL